jgi:hypothetical protein
MTTNEQRPYGWTSADAAGLSVFAGLVRYDEAAPGTRITPQILLSNPFYNQQYKSHHAMGNQFVY